MVKQDDILEQAAEWVVKLSTSSCTEQDLLVLEQWKQQSPEHLAAFNKLYDLINGVQSLQQHDLNSTHPLVQHQVMAKKSRLPKHASILVLIFAMSWLIVSLPWSIWTSDVHTSTASWQHSILEDKSTLSTSGKTAYNVKFSKQQRSIELLEGNILIDVAKDSQRPFIVDTGGVKIKALGTRFIVQHHGKNIIVSMIESKTQVYLQPENKNIVLRTGEVLNIEHGQYQIQSVAPDVLAQAWQDKKMVVNKMPLDQVLSILQDYHHTHYMYSSSELAQYTVTAVLPLDQPEIALQLLKDHIGLNIKHYSPYLTRISKRN